MVWRVVISVFTVVLWILGPVTCEKDSDTCVFYYWQVDWKTAVKTCASEDKKLLCYKSKSEIDDITEAFRLTAIGSAKLALWLSNRNCSYENELEECLSLHIEKSGSVIWHYFQDICNDAYQFACCVNGTPRTTTSVEYVTKTTLNQTSDIFDITDSSLATTTHTSSSVRTPFCKEVSERGILWPDTNVGKVAIRPCPGNSVGKARWACELRNVSSWKDVGPDLTKCRSLEIQNLKERFNSSSASEVISELTHIFEDQKKEIFAEDLADVIYLMTALPDRLFRELESFTSPVKWTSAKDSVGKVMSVMDRIVELKDTWNDIEEKGRLTIGSQLLSTVDGMGSFLADSMPENQEKESVEERNMALQVLRPKLGESVSLPQWDPRWVTSRFNYKGNVVLEKGYDKQLVKDEGNISLVFAFYTDMSSILSPTQEDEVNRTSSLNSAVVSTTVVQGRQPVRISNEVRIVLEHLTSNPNHSACVFWNMESDQWDTSGCRLESSNETNSVCVCNHLTNFALLMDYRDVLSDLDQLPFHYITVIGCSLSILCLAICVIIFSCYSYHSRHSWGLRYVIHRNLSLTLLIANLILVFGLDKKENQRVCATIAGLLHYFFLSAFSWMLLEGVHIYLLLVVVFASRKSHSEKYYLFGYGFPLVIVGITAISRPMYYGTDEVCWLSVEKGTIWGFMGPVAAILILNTAALILAQYKASRISIKDDKVALLKRWLRVTFILFPVLGITWVFGFLYLGKHFEIAGYLFAVFNSFQGVCIFVFHCLLDKKARNMVMDSIKKKNSSIHTGSSGTHKKLKEHPQNGVKSNSITPIENDVLSPSSKQKAFQMPRSEKSKTDWSKWRKPWSFCFEMPISDKSLRKEQDCAPQAVVVHWNSLKEKSCA